MISTSRIVRSSGPGVLGITDDEAQGPQHSVVVPRGTIPAEVLALAEDADLQHAKTAKVLVCGDCAEFHSAVEMYRESSVPGLCVDCAETWWGCPECGEQHHPDDPCE